MNDTTTDTAEAGYHQDELAWFAGHYADTDWIVHVIGPDEIHTNANPDLDDDDPANPVLTEQTAHELAASLNAAWAQYRATSAHSEFGPQAFHATVFHRGVPHQQAGPDGQVEGQGALPIETEPATAPCPSCDGRGQETDADGASQGECLRCHGSGTVEAPSIWITHGGADRQVPYRPTTSLADLFAAACDAFNLGDSERQRLGLFNSGGVQLDTDGALLHVAPGDLLVLRPRIVGA